MPLTRAAARKVARQIYERFGARIAAACKGTPVPPEFVAGLIANEAGKDRRGVISETATRFEPGVFRKLQQIRDGSRKSWSGIRQADIETADDNALRALATSYSLTQIMGWHCIHSLDCSIAQLRDPQQHLKHAVKLLMLNAADGDFERRAFMGEFREWNTGSERGKTYHADYVANGMAVMAAYAEMPAIPVDGAVVDTPPAPESLTEAAAAGELIVGTRGNTNASAPVVHVEHADEVTADAPIAVPGGHKDDPPMQATQGGNKSLIATAIGVLAGVGTAIKGFFDGDHGLAMVGVVCGTIVLLALIFRQLIIDHFRMKYASDPGRINVK